jgi:hypothetical protein
VNKLTSEFQQHPFRLDDAVLRIAAKVGAAVFPGDGDDPDMLLKSAETALKRAKASGERYLFYTQEMTDRMAGKPSLENRLRLALDKGEFVLHYQPKVSLASGKVTGAEALIRWNDPATGLVPPGPLHPGARGDRPHLRGRPMGDAPGDPGFPALARGGPGFDPHRGERSRRCSCETADSRPRSPRRLPSTRSRPRGSSSRSRRA